MIQRGERIRQYIRNRVRLDDSLPPDVASEFQQIADAIDSDFGAMAAGPWIPGEPPEECKASVDTVLIWDFDSPVIGSWEGLQDAWTDRAGDHIYSTAFYSRIIPPNS